MTEAPAGQVKVGLGRSNAVVTLAVLVFLGWIVWAGARGGWNAAEMSTPYIGFGVAALFLIPLVMMLWALPKFLRPRYVVFDAQGLRILHGRREAVIAWAAMSAVGMAYEQAAEERQALPTSVDEQIAELKRRPGKEILVFGSRTMWNHLVAAGLVDELHLMIGPAFLGGGTPVFEGRPSVALRLLDSRTLEGSELVLTRHGVRDR